jgi:hypothetical protein
MSKLAAFAVLCGGLGLGGCSFTHVRYPAGERQDYIDLEANPANWGEHYYYDAAGYDR